jgi:dipeptidyl aminopeptidase/acylaminoacyl peptidase
MLKSLLVRASLVPVLVCVCAISARADLSLKQIMQDPGWIGPPVEAAWWQLAEDSYQYRVKRGDSAVRDVYRQSLDGGDPVIVQAAALLAADGPDPVLDRAGTRALSIVAGSLMLRDLQTGSLQRLYTGTRAVQRAQFSAAEDAAQFLVDDRWWRVGFAGGAATPVADLRFEDAPDAVPDDALELDQLRLFSTLERVRSQGEELHATAIARERAAAALGPAAWYLGEDMEPVSSTLSADGRWLMMVVQKADVSAGNADKMPRFVDRSGYVAIEDVRRLVGRDEPQPQSLWLLDLETRTRHALDLSTLSGRADDPLRDLKEAQDISPHDRDSLRPLEISRVVWHPQQAQALVQVFSIDNKDRWTLRVDAPGLDFEEIDRLSDKAWINWAFNELGWIPGTDSAWMLSEKSGYSQLYRIDSGSRPRALTSGEFEVHSLRFARDGGSALLLSNRAHPTEYDLYEFTLADRELRQLSNLKGVESFAVHPDERRVLLRHSGSYTPIQALVLDIESGELSAATDTRTEAYRAIAWQSPQIVAVPSTHGAGQPIWSKFYPAAEAFSGPRPVVMFVHGAGYTQNTHNKFPYYFREQMFHNLLTARGYHVLDMDFRASRGYGRDWRTAIYRHMGQPELEDLLDGVTWLVDEHDADPERIGVYGGSYGGFMTFMALFKAPEVFAAGASLRPVTDWRHYNHGYTSNILNTPEIDPEAHRRSSPIEFVEGLQGDLLISHGMLDDNVFYKDSVRLVQRLIELEKENWELASYPLEPHGYVHPESWLDQYRRILKLFESSIGD